MKYLLALLARPVYVDVDDDSMKRHIDFTERQMFGDARNRQVGWRSTTREVEAFWQRNADLQEQAR
jgi:hypothetical protein